MLAPEAIKIRFAAEDLQGLKYFGPIRKLLARLHGEAAHPNRKLFYDQYLALLLLFYFNPVLKALRDIQYASTLRKVQKLTGCSRTSLGSLSESSHVFAPAILKRLFHELAEQALARDAPARPADLPPELALLAMDGSLLEALPKMLWAVWQGPHHNAVKLHLQYDVLAGAPADMHLTPGNGDERTVLAENLRAACVYLIDRGYLNYELFQKIIDARSSFVARVHENVAFEGVEERLLTPEAQAAGVVSDQTVWLGGEQSHKALKQPLRLVHVHVKNPPSHNLKPPQKHVNAKVKAVRSEAPEEYDLWLATDRLDLSAETIALLYRFRWQVELFFRWFKCVLGCKHLLSLSPQGIEIQVYAALIATLLIVLWTGRKPNRRTLTVMGLYIQGWVEDDELAAYIGRLPKAV
jgi:hypothetical protein